MSIGARIKAARAQADLSMSELAARARVSKGYLHALENEGSGKVGAEVLLRLCQVLGVSADWLLGRVEDTSFSATTAEVQLAEALREVAELREWQRRVRAAVAGRGEGEAP